ncbi:MAG TPA: glycosyltransferase [Thermoplasmata archaeon]|nr:glycosyltransferase [Thermoplasmata archaeon]
MPVSVSAVVVAHDPGRAGMLREAVASAGASGADEIVVVRPYGGVIEGWEGRYRDLRSTDPTLAGKQADGVDAATGEVVAFLDDDDLWKPDKVGVLRDRFAARPDLILLNHAYDRIDEAGRPLGPGTPADGRWTLSSNLAVRRSWAVERTDVLRAAGWEADETWSLVADVDRPNGVEVLARSLTLWRYHAANVSRSHRTTAQEFRTAHARLYPRWVRAEGVMLRYARDHGLPETSPIVARRRRRLAEFTFLAALENDSDARAAARTLLRTPDVDRGVRQLARLSSLSPALARYALFRFNRFH